MKTIIELFKNKRGRWGWRSIRAGRIIEGSTQPNGYSSRTKCRSSLNRFTKSIEAGEVEYRNLFRDTKSEQ